MVLFIADISSLALSDRWRSYLPLLDAADRERVLRFVREEDRVRCVTGCLLIRSEMALRFPDLSPEIARSDYGKPYAPGQNGFEFNLSHSGRLVALAVDETPIGVDVEEQKPIDPMTFRRLLDKNEEALIQRAASPSDTFYKIWVIKEAFSKEQGVGLSLFDTPEHNLPFIVDYDKKEISYREKTYYFWTDTYENHALAICSERPIDDCVPQILTPDQWEKRLSASPSTKTPSR